jgi:hypothetical protein
MRQQGSNSSGCGRLKNVESEARLMSEEQKDKPIRELLQDISANSEVSHGPSRGFVDPKLVNRITFFASFACLLLTTAAFLAMIWDFTNPEFGFRCVGSILVILVALFIFRAINAQFD